ncbi:hypothetical protein CVT26_010589 [Gymnopilus dilepis]|uniref:ribonuclease H n=1 Tax=Gymnopilus dilepis TaxID=231916 RepID=A0A409VZF2_9AGAR|nr:hypothetical protein CVT26_010589 [Gymnopilus dilepis]
MTDLPDGEVLKQRIGTPCPSLAGLDINQIIIECPECHRYVRACCRHGYSDGRSYHFDQHLCHLFKVVYTDGACTNNGGADAKAGLGLAIGTNVDAEEHTKSIPVDDSIDPGAPRTSQRAELLAAIEGLKLLEETPLPGHRRVLRAFARRDGDNSDDERDVYLVVTDSEYVVKGMTEWLPSWKRRGLRTSGGKRPTNLDLFLALDRLVTRLENDRVAVGFWQVPRAFNQQADALAKRAASNAI